MASATTIQLNGRSDWTLMTAIQDALRRDLDELVHITASRAAARARRVAFRDQPDFHLAAEDAALWPPARARLTGDPHGQAAAVRAASAGWASRGACQDSDPDLFFPVATSGPALQQTAQAKAVCARCPVRIDCLSYALETGQDAWGVGRHERGRAPGDPISQNSGGSPPPRR